jgi:hypothetical protein
MQITIDVRDNETAAEAFKRAYEMMGWPAAPPPEPAQPAEPKPRKPRKSSTGNGTVADALTGIGPDEFRHSEAAPPAAFTTSDVIKKIQEVMDALGTECAVALLADFGAKKISDIDPLRYSDIVERADKFIEEVMKV